MKRGIAILFLAALVSALGQGCGPSALKRSALGARVVREPLNQAAALVETTCTPERAESLPEIERPGFIAQCFRAEETLEAAVQAWVLWVDALLHKAEGGDFNAQAALHFAIDVAKLYGETVDVLSAYDVQFPQLPDEVRRLIGGPQ